METIVIRDKNTKEEKVVLVKTEEKEYVLLSDDLEVATDQKDSSLLNLWQHQ